MVTGQVVQPARESGAGAVRRNSRLPGYWARARMEVFAEHFGGLLPRPESNRGRIAGMRRGRSLVVAAARQ